jgi:acetyltransferase EpsM
MIIIGAGGHGRVIADILIEQGVQDIRFWVDQPVLNLVNGLPVEQRETATKIPVIIGIGDNRTRKRIALENRYTYSLAIHPNANISKFCDIGIGTVCMAGAIINTNARIGQHVIINTGTVIDHDANIADFAHVSPNATLAGNVTIGEGAWIGAGAVVIPGIKIGKWAIVGAGAVVIRDIPDYAVAVGNPAKIFKYNSAE